MASIFEKLWKLGPAAFVLKAIIFAVVADTLLLAFILLLGSVLQEEITYKRYNDWQDVVRLVSYCFLEHFPYRQMHMFWRLRGIWQYLRGDNVCEPLKRKGLQSASIP